MKSETPNKGLEWTNLHFGIVAACAAFMLTGAPAAAWSAGIVGSLIGLCSASARCRYDDWTEWCNITLSSWAVVAPFVLGFESAPAAMWTHVLIGLIVLVIAVIHLLASRKGQ